MFSNMFDCTSHVFLAQSSSYKNIKKEKRLMKNRPFICNGCQKSYSNYEIFRDHVRRRHFNLKARNPCRELKEVNQIWFEKVQNTQSVVEIKKIGPNRLLLKKVSPEYVTISENETEIIDLSQLYPVTCRAKCKLCKRIYAESYIKKHMEIRHRERKCNVCNVKLKKYMRHACPNRVKLEKEVK